MTTNIFQLLEATAARFPRKLAISDGTRDVTFSQWLDCAKRIGSAIVRDHPGVMRRPVMVFVDRRVEPLVAFLGVVASGNFYVPIDCKMPAERMKHIIGVLNPLAAVTVTDDDEKLLDESAYAGPRCPYETAITAEVDVDALAKVQDELIDLDPVYCIFTSGSTGVPKGALVSHRAMMDFGDWMFSRFDMSSEDIIGNQAPFYFDLSVKDVLLCLGGGDDAHHTQEMLCVPEASDEIPEREEGDVSLVGDFGGSHDGKQRHAGIGSAEVCAHCNLRR